MADMVGNKVKAGKPLIDEREERRHLVGGHPQGIWLVLEDRVRRADNRVVAPRDDEEVAALVADRQRMALRQRPRDHVDPLRADQLVGLAARAFDQFKQPVRPRPRSVDGQLAAYRCLRPVQPVADAHAMDRAALAIEGDGLRMVGDHRAMLDRIDEALKPQSLGRIHLAVIVEHRAVELCARQRRLERPRLGRAKRPVRRYALVGIIQPVAIEGQQVIEREPCIDHQPVRRLLQR